MSDKVFKTDTVRLILNTGKVLTGIGVLKIKYKRPDGSSGFWNATIDSDPNRLYADVVFDTKGIWQVQAYTLQAGKSYHGMWSDVKVYEQIAFTTTIAPTTPAP